METSNSVGMSVVGATVNILPIRNGNKIIEQGIKKITRKVNILPIRNGNETCP